MANFDLYYKPYIKLGTDKTVCYCCIKDECASSSNSDVHDVTFNQLGKLENKLVFYIRRSGQDTCICFDCFKKIYEQIIADELKQENKNIIDNKEDNITIDNNVETNNSLASTDNTNKKKSKK